MKKVKLNYVNAVPKTPPVEKIEISESDKFFLNLAIQEKLEQNQIQYIEGLEVASHLHVGGHVPEPNNEKPKVKKLNRNI